MFMHLIELAPEDDNNAVEHVEGPAGEAGNPNNDGSGCDETEDNDDEASANLDGMEEDNSKENDVQDSGEGTDNNHATSDSQDGNYTAGSRSGDGDEEKIGDELVMTGTRV
jgi:hypothetical protein